MKDATPATRPRSGGMLTIIGLALTAGWILLGFDTVDVSEVTQLPPNELGDFLAGAFAPLAFLWLVLGFFQQGTELRNSGEALWLQGRELQNSVEQQRELVETARQQLAFELRRVDEEGRLARSRAIPIFAVRADGSAADGTNDGTRICYLKVVNHGPPCTAVKISDTLNGTLKELPKFDTGTEERIGLRLKAEFDDFGLTISYIDGMMSPGLVEYVVKGPVRQMTIVEQRETFD